MIRSRFLITLPYQAPQLVDVLTWGPGYSRLSLIDRFDRRIWLQGEDVGFDVVVYRSTAYPPVIKLTILGDYDEALWSCNHSHKIKVPIKKVENHEKI